jgi:hypothetical protein
MAGMDAGKPYNRLSVAQAADRAERLATEFLARECPGKDWQFVKAFPARKRTSSDRKVLPDWRVFVRWADPPDSVCDGNESTVVVNLSTREVRFGEIPE